MTALKSLGLLTASLLPTRQKVLICSVFNGNTCARSAHPSLINNTRMDQEQHRARMTHLILITLVALFGTAVVAVAQAPDEEDLEQISIAGDAADCASTRSAPPDTTPYVRPIVPEDYAPGGKPAIPSNVQVPLRDQQPNEQSPDRRNDENP
jgi:hypothetical protein